jgi:8-oxo-dGTP pyrophosphatase MutT (NUDIX family)
MSTKIKAERETGYGAGVLFIDPETKRCLWIKRSENGDFPGYWCCPGGGVEDHETIDQAVRREVQEECGYSEPYDLHHLSRIEQPGFVYHNHIAAVPEFEPTLNDEHTEFVWSNTMPEPIHPGLKQAIEEYTARYK